jgi:zinc protease
MLTSRSRAHRFGALVALFSSASAAAQAPPVAKAEDARTAPLSAVLPVGPDVTVGTLPNGLRYYIRENRRPEKRAELRLVVNAGSILEDDDQRGLAHFVEHMAFNGTRNFPKQKLVAFLESIGMRFGPELNASTSFDETVYMLRVPTDNASAMPTAFQILEDWAHQVSFEPQEIDKERGVVVEEWRLGQGAGARMRDRQFPIVFAGSRYAERLPIGTRETLESFPHAALTRFYRDWYRPDLMAVIAVGDFATSDVEPLVRKHFGSIARPPAARARTPFGVPEHAGTRVGIATDKEAASTTVTVYQTMPLEDERTVGAYRQSIVEALYNAMLNNRLSELAQKPDPPFIGAFSGKGRLVRTAEAYTLGAAVREDGIARGLQTLLVESERVARFGFTPSELDREKKDLLREMERLYTDREKQESGLYAAEYIRAFLEDEPIPGIAYEFELHKRFVPEITLGEINALARKWITERGRIVLVNGPDKAGLRVPGEADLRAAIDGVNTLAIAAYVDTVAEKPLVETLPAPGAFAATKTVPAVGVTEWTLANGVRVIVKPTDFKQDEIVFQGFSPGGTSLASDADYIPALSASSVVGMGGLGAFSSIDLRKVLAGRMAAVRASVSSFEEGVSGSTAPNDLETALQLVYLSFTAPRADPAIFDVMKTQMKTMLANRLANPQVVYGETLQSVLTQDHPRARPMTGETIDRFDLDKSMAFYKDRFADASDFTFVIVGNIDPEALKPLVARYLGSLPATGRRETWRDEGIRPPKGVVAREVRKGLEPKSQTTVVFTGPFQYDRDHRNAIRALGMVLEARLRQRLREQLGGTYGVSVSPSTDWRPTEDYQFVIAFGSAPERAEELTKAIFDEIDALKATAPEDVEVSTVREQLLREFETGTRQNGYWLTQLGYKYRRNEDPSDIPAYPESLRKLSPAVVQDAAKTYLDVGHYVLVRLMPEK